MIKRCTKCKHWQRDLPMLQQMFAKGIVEKFISKKKAQNSLLNTIAKNCKEYEPCDGD